MRRLEVHRADGHDRADEEHGREPAPASSQVAITVEIERME
jgi:hypothetical protein